MRSLKISSMHSRRSTLPLALLGHMLSSRSCLICKSHHCHTLLWASQRSKHISCYNQYMSFNKLSTFSSMHLILLWHVIILSQDTLIFIYFLMRSMTSPMLAQPSFNLCAMHGYAFLFFSSIWCLTHHTCYASILCLTFLITVIHSRGLRVFLMHSVLVDSIQSCTNTMSSI